MDVIVLLGMGAALAYWAYRWGKQTGSRLGYRAAGRRRFGRRRQPGRHG